MKKFTPYTAIVPSNLCCSPVDPNLASACGNILWKEVKEDIAYLTERSHADFRQSRTQLLTQRHSGTL